MSILPYILCTGFGFGCTGLLFRSLNRPDLPMSKIQRYTACVLVATLALMLYYRLGPTVMLIRCAGLLPFLVTAAAIDRQYGLIPNRLIQFGSASALLIGCIQPELLGRHLAVMLLTAGVLCLIRRSSLRLWNHPGLGMGDVKLASMTGLFLGWPVLWILYLATVIGAVIGLAGVMSGRLDRRAGLPFAPMLAGAAPLHWFLIPPEVVLSL